MPVLRPDPARIATVGGTATWHVLRTIPGREAQALDWLAAHGFGGYLPMHDTWDRERRKRQTVLFPGYLFVMLFGLPANIAKLHDCPGVLGWLLDSAGVPILVPDSVMRDVQNIEWRNWVANLPRSFFRRRRRHEQPWTIEPWSHVQYGFRSPDAETRVSALQKALGIG